MAPQATPRPPLLTVAQTYCRCTLGALTPVFSRRRSYGHIGCVIKVWPSRRSHPPCFLPPSRSQRGLPCPSHRPAAALSPDPPNISREIRVPPAKLDLPFPPPPPPPRIRWVAPESIVPDTIVPHSTLIAPPPTERNRSVRIVPDSFAGVRPPRPQITTSRKSRTYRSRSSP